MQQEFVFSDSSIGFSENSESHVFSRELVAKKVNVLFMNISVV
jgi:hypothetical protein